MNACILRASEITMPHLSEKEVQTQDRVAEFYEDKRYSRWYSQAYQKWWSKKMIALLPSGLSVLKILDNGCGTANFVECLKPESIEKTVGSDISWEMLVRAKKRLPRIVQSDAQQLPFKDAQFDVVFSRALLHHLPDPDAGAKEVRRVLAQGGYAVMVDTVETLMSSLPRKMTEDSDHFSEEHKNFKGKEYLAMVGEHLAIKKVVYFGYIAYPLLGFPDIIDVFRFVPLKKIMVPLLNAIDWLIERTPLLNKHLAWGVMVLARKE